MGMGMCKIAQTTKQERTNLYQHLNIESQRQRLDFVENIPAPGSAPFSSADGSGSSGCVRAVDDGKAGLIPCSRFLRASTTLRTRTAKDMSASSLHNARKPCKDIRANVSSMFTISLALVSMKPYPLLRAHSSPCLAPTCRWLWRSHLLPATMHTGRVTPLSILVSLSMSMSELKYSS
jgi:hypothetical protein